MILGHKIPHLPHFGYKKNFSQKRALSLFCIYWTLTSSREPEKIRNQSWEKGVTNSWTEWRMERAESLGPSGRAAGWIKYWVYE